MKAVTIQQAAPEDIPALKQLTDTHRQEFGFITVGAFRDSIAKQECKVAVYDGCIVGFVRYHQRRDGITTLYEIVVHPDYRGQCIGTQLIVCVPYTLALRLKCPTDNPANAFYDGLGFACIGTEDGRRRPLNVWQRLRRMLADASESA